ncbi:Hypothetical_protein [Hexamita inflata]|uniref:Hypothetical_protein n=1 Tax=Hexamita inflata TaxID=28002 RepID=A0AA86QSM0_9EUKA|nr:Hypothetical protein HINF_LOCUS46149 [Hexamita inflata]
MFIQSRILSSIYHFARHFKTSTKLSFQSYKLKFTTPPMMLRLDPADGPLLRIFKLSAQSLLGLSSESVVIQFKKLSLDIPLESALLQRQGLLTSPLSKECAQMLLTEFLNSSSLVKNQFCYCARIQAKNPTVWYEQVAKQNIEMKTDSNVCFVPSYRLLCLFLIVIGTVQAEISDVISSKKQLVEELKICVLSMKERKRVLQKLQKQNTTSVNDMYQEFSFEGVEKVPEILQCNRTDDCYTQLFKIAVLILTKQDVENEMLQNFQLLLKLKEKELEIKSCGQSAAGSVLQHLITKQYLCNSIILNIDETFFRPSFHLLYLYLKKDENLFNELNNTFRLNKLTNNLPHECESEIVEVMDKFDAKGNFQRMLDYNGYQVNKNK